MKRHPFEHPVSTASIPPHPDVRQAIAVAMDAHSAGAAAPHSWRQRMSGLRPRMANRKATSRYALGGMDMIKMSPFWAITVDIVTSTVITGGTAISAIMIHGQSVSLPTPTAWFSIGVGSVVSAAAIVRARLALPPAEASR